MEQQITTHLIADEIVVERAEAYTEAGLLANGTIRVYAEDGEGFATVTYTIDEARELAEHLMHLVWTAEHS